MTFPILAGAVWQDAACLGGDPSLWFDYDAESRRAAKAICAGCPIRVECLAHALATPELFGVWGGKDERERRRILARLDRP